LDIKRYIEQLEILVSSHSVSSTRPELDQSNEGVVTILANWLDDLGFTCSIQQVPERKGKFNLVATKGEGTGGLVFAGHTDTVPCNPELWQQDPFTLSDKDDRLYGLGATDMKGFFPAVLAAIEQVKNTDFNQPLIVLATADEETSMSGARALAHRPGELLKARQAIVGEPTSMRPINMHKGMMMESVRVKGKSGHSSDPGLGINALEVMNQIISQLVIYRSLLEQQYNNPGFHIPTPTLNLGCIHGGDNPNRICPSCELHFDLRPLPGMLLDDLRKDLQKVLRLIAMNNKCDIVFNSLFPGVEAFHQDSESDIVKEAESLTGFPTSSVAFATEAPFLQSLGMETIILGPGSITQAHQPNEFIEKDQIDSAVDVLTKMIHRFCL